MGPVRKAHCSVCGKLHRIRNDGKILVHKPPEAVGSPSYRPRTCPGSHKKPKN